MNNKSDQNHLSTNKGEIRIVLDIIEPIPINEYEYGSQSYFLVHIREKFQNQLFKCTDLLDLKRILIKERLLLGFTLERLDPDLIMIIIHGNSCDYVKDLKQNWKNYMENLCELLQNYYNRLDKQNILGLKYFKIKIDINEDDLENVLSDWEMNLLPIKYKLKNSVKDLQMARLTKSEQIRLLQTEIASLQETCNKLNTLIPDFLIYLEQLVIQLEENPNNNSEFLHLLTNGVVSMVDISSLYSHLDKYKGSSIDPKGLRSQPPSLILHTLERLRVILKQILCDVVTPLFQIRIGCESDEQIFKKKQILAETNRVINEIEITEANTVHTSTLKPPSSWIQSIRQEHFCRFGWMLGLIMAILDSLVTIDFQIDEYFQLGCMTNIVSMHIDPAK